MMHQGKNVQFEDYLNTFSDDDRKEIEKMTQIILGNDTERRNQCTENKDTVAKETDGTAESLDSSRKR